MKTVFGDRIAPTLVSCTLISEQGLRDSETAGSFCIPLSAHPQKGMQNMKLKLLLIQWGQVQELCEFIVEGHMLSELYLVFMNVSVTIRTSHIPMLAFDSV